MESSGAAAPVPADGFLVYMDAAFTSTEYFRTPLPGTPVTAEYYLHTADPEGFQEARFTTAVSPRTAIGVNAAGKLVPVPAASIQQIRGLIWGLDACNLDGGASCGMYYNGTYLAGPGRELTVTLQVFLK